MMRMMRFQRIFPLIALPIGALASSAQALSVQEIVRLQGRGQTVLQGVGLVVGLPGTGDSGEDLIVARPLAKLLENSGNPVGSFEELAEAQSAALVMVTATIDKTGARPDDVFDASVSALNNPESLRGGELFLTPLRGPMPGQGVYAIAQGQLVIEDDNPNHARVRGGARIVKPIHTPTISDDGSITLLIHPNFAGWTTAQLLANTVNQHQLGLGESSDQIARAIDGRTVRVRIPAADLADPANFIADIMSIRFDPSLLDLPARVVVNEREGIIAVTGDVEISPTALTHGDLMVTTVNPPPEPAPNNPQVEQQRWSAVATDPQQRQSAKLQDLLAAFKQLDVPVDDQIAILSLLHRTGRLHAELIIE